MIFQLKHIICLTIVVTATVETVAVALPKLKPVQESTRSITRIGSGVSKDVEVPVSTRYITIKSTVMDSNQSKTFMITLCDSFKGQTITANVLLYDNYIWNPMKQVVFYYIVDAKSKTLKDSLCSNSQKESVDPGPACIIKKFASTEKTLYLKANTVSHAASFSIDINIGSTSSQEHDLKEMNTQEANATSNHKFQLKNVEDKYLQPSNETGEYLTEVITLASNQLIDIDDSALLHVNFCPRPDQSKKFNVRNTVTATDGVSAFAQFVCSRLPCTPLTTDNFLEFNTNQVPLNEVVVGPESSGKLEVYIRVVPWAASKTGPKTYESAFMYTGEIIPM